MNSIKKNQRKKKEEEKKENFVLRHIKKRNTVSQENIFKLSDYTSTLWKERRSSGGIATDL